MKMRTLKAFAILLYLIASKGNLRTAMCKDAFGQEISSR